MKRISKLQTKTSLAILSMALLLSLTTVTASYFRYTSTFEEHYIKLATNVATTASQLLDPEDVLAFREEVAAIYLENPAPEFQSPEEAEAYLAQYDHLREGYHDEIYDLLDIIKSSNTNVTYLYIAYLHAESMSAIYLVDVDDSDSACPTGTWDIIYPQNYEYMQTASQEMPTYITTSDFGTLSTAAVPIVTADGTIAAHAMVDVSMDDIIHDRVQFMYLLITMVLLFTSIAIVVGNHWIGLILVKPINSLADATREYVDQQEHGMTQDCSALAMLDIHTGDEIEHLATSIQQMESDINNYILTLTVFTAERERIGAELTVATNIQASMLPTHFPAFPERPEFDLYATMTPAKEVGGDFYDFFLVDDDHLAMVIADVSGKGVPAALFMVIAKTLLKNALQSGRSPSDALEHVNNQLCENNDEGMIVTTWAGVLEIKSGLLTCANAGHEPPALQRAGEDFQLVIEKHGFVLAGLEDMKYKNYEIQLEPEDVLFLYTDGVGEATTLENDMFGHDRMLVALKESNSNDPMKILDNVSEEIDKFVGEAPQFDDITMLGFRYRPTLSKKLQT